MNSRKSLIALLAFFLVIFGASVVLPEGPVQDFTLINHTGYTIVSIYLSPTRANNWRAEYELGNYVSSTIRKLT